MLSPQQLVKGLVARFLPAANPDGSSNDVPLRLDRYGAVSVAGSIPLKHSLAEEGAYVIANGGTPDTGQTWVAAQTAYSATTPNFLISNADPVKSFYLDYVKMKTLAAMTSAVVVEYAITVDTALRLPTTQHMAGYALNPSNIGAPKTTTVSLQVQSSATASVIPALSANGYIAAQGTFGGINIINDVWIIQSGGPDMCALQGLTAAEATTPSRRIDVCAPIVVGPGCSACVHIWAVSSSASPAPEFEVTGWIK